MGISRTLKTLSITCTSSDYEFPSIEWPQLQKFRCLIDLDLPRCHRIGGQDDPCELHGLLTRLAEKWVMPSLGYLTLESTCQSHFFRDCFPLFERYKDQLVYLNANRIYSEEASDLTSVLKMMPRLQHLVLNGTVSFAFDASHPELKQFDVWGDWIPTRIYEGAGSFSHTGNMGVIDNSAAFPMLKHVRFFDNGLASTVSGVDLPLVIPPTDHDSHPAAVECIQYTGVDIQVLGGRVVCRNDLYYVDDRLDAPVIFQLCPPENLTEDDVDDGDGILSHLGSFKQWPLSDSDSGSDYSPESRPAYSDNGTASDDDSDYWEYRSDSSAGDSLFDDIRDTVLDTVTS
ncbi:hypothetical protein AAF712_010817 [Marasmius tenuissimus]|uniref:Uncharacterized protein n=1 Tax=Marasmius tenuissimus TaxID=585030 RepID=A0ABR2ZLS2_9AGAR